MLSEHCFKRLPKFSTMKIFRAVGLGVGLLILKIIMPDVFSGLEHALVKFFSVLADVMGKFPNPADQSAMIYPHAVPMPGHYY